MPTDISRTTPEGGLGASPPPPQRPQRRKLRTGGFIVLALLGLALVARVLVAWVLPVHALAHVPGQTNPGTSPPEPVGTEILFGVDGLSALGHKPVDLVSARIVHVPPGIEAVSVNAVHYGTTGPLVGHIGAIDTQPQNLAADGPLPTQFPVSAVRLQPRTRTDWYLLATIKVLRPGTFDVSDVAVTYRVGGRTGVETYPIYLTVKGVAAP
jgi:hypothetical protein